MLPSRATHGLSSLPSVAWAAAEDDRTMCKLSLEFKYIMQAYTSIPSSWNPQQSIKRSCLPTQHGALRMSHVKYLLLIGFVQNEVYCSWNVIFSHFIKTAEQKRRQPGLKPGGLSNKKSFKSANQKSFICFPEYVTKSQQHAVKQVQPT